MCAVPREPCRGTPSMLRAGGMPLLAPRARAFSARLEGAGRSLPRGCGAEGAPASSTGLRWLRALCPLKRSRTFLCLRPGGTSAVRRRGSWAGGAGGDRSRTAGQRRKPPRLRGAGRSQPPNVASPSLGPSGGAAGAEPSRTEPSPPHRQRSAARLRGPPRTPGGPSRARAVRSRPRSSPALVGGPGPRLSARARREAAVLPGEGAAASGGLGVRAQSKRCLGRGREAGRPACRPPVFAC